MERRKRKQKGFTLIELLAVIVILGLLMAIAIPSVTKYITESRKKTLTTTVGNYIGALVNEVNDLSYTFTGYNTIYAVPIECISLERGGTDPFGHWYQANDSYFAYVLVQYDDEASKYVYGFTFKDSAGYGLYPTIQPNIKEKGSQIKTGYTINKPKTGDITSLTTLAKWQESGFEVDSTTDFQVLQAASEGEIGDGKTTCTLQQKGDNYSQVEEEKQTAKMNYPAYAIYFEDDSSFVFVRSKTEINEGDVYSGKSVTKVYTGFEALKYIDYRGPWPEIQSKVKKVIVKDVIKPFITVRWFQEFRNCEYLDLSKLDMSNVTSMERMFSLTGINAESFSLIGLENWDVSKVTNMESLFSHMASETKEFNLNINNWDTSNVTTMGSMFWGFGENITNFDLDLSNWDTSKVTTLNGTFQTAGKNSTTFKLDLSGWDTANVKTMVGTFREAGNLSTTFNLIGLDNWNVSNVTTMKSMFGDTFAAKNAAGYKATTFNIGDLSKWNTSKVTDMSYMFAGVGGSATTFNIGDLKNWDTSNVTLMTEMFLYAGDSATTFNIGDISNWDTSNVLSMTQMFYYTGYKASWSLDCSKWNVDKVNGSSGFNSGVTDKVIAPKWVN